MGKVEPDEAESKANQVDYLLRRIRQRLLTVATETDTMLFLQQMAGCRDGMSRVAALLALAETLSLQGSLLPRTDLPLKLPKFRFRLSRLHLSSSGRYWARTNDRHDVKRPATPKYLHFP
jgi:hypothetical protein